VLCEKPLSRRPRDVAAAFDVAEQRGLVLMEAFMYRHHPQTRHVAELVHGGAIGRLRLVRATFTFPLSDPADIRMLRELDGGALMDVGCYCISGARLLAGEPERVYGEGVVSDAGVDVAFSGTLRFRAEVLAQFDASFVAPVRQSLEAIGEEGTILVQAPWRQDWGGDVLLRRGEGVERVGFEKADSYRLELENMSLSIRGRAEPLLGREDAVAQARTLDALYRSAEEGRAVTL
jgi:D-xylose 1-dehydrogenase (NADP+, D-xylono-1,5-lactone-forming)